MQILYSKGNTKIPVTARTMIINMGSATDCPSRNIGLCQLDNPNKCYALKAEKLYPTCLPYRTKQATIWQELSAFEIADQISNIQSKKRNKFKYVRFNESGDFNNVYDILKLMALANYLDIPVYTYTSRKDLLQGTLLRTVRNSRLIVNGSGFMADNNFKIVGKDYKLKKGEVWCKGNCLNCKLCKGKHGLTICNKEQ